MTQSTKVCFFATLNYVAGYGGRACPATRLPEDDHADSQGLIAVVLCQVAEKKDADVHSHGVAIDGIAHASEEESQAQRHEDQARDKDGPDQDHLNEGRHPVAI